jgi:hypothetical protein
MKNKYFFTIIAIFNMIVCCVTYSEGYYVFAIINAFFAGMILSFAVESFLNEFE